MFLFWAVRDLGVCYENGYGIEKNLKVAYTLYELANNNGNLSGKFICY